MDNSYQRKSCIGGETSELRILRSISLFVLLNDGTRSAHAGVLLGKIDGSLPSEKHQRSCQEVSERIRSPW